jgi:hypothetical protein
VAYFTIRKCNIFPDECNISTKISLRLIHMQLSVTFFTYIFFIRRLYAAQTATGFVQCPMTFSSNIYLQKMSKQRGSLFRLRARKHDETRTFDCALDMARLIEGNLEYQGWLERSSNINAESATTSSGPSVRLRLESHGA